MMAEGEAAAEREPTGKLRAGKPPRSGFALLATRISSWTTRCLLSALILLASLAFGRQVIEWWQADEPASVGPPPQLAMTDGLGDPERTHQLQFGDAPWAIVRRVVVASREEAAALLRSSCRELTIASPLPAAPAGPSEQEFLASLVGESPVDEEAGQWQIYQLQSGFPMVVATRAAAIGPPSTEGEQVAEESRRVVTWGLAVPVADRTWTLYTFYPATSANGPLADLPEIPLPPNSRKTISMRASGGGAMVAFNGEPQGGEWRAFFDRWFHQRGWRAVAKWTRSGSTWHARYARAADRPAQTVDVQFGPDGRGRLAGLLLVTSAHPKPAKSEGS